jgi:hypothetical protein
MQTLRAKKEKEMTVLNKSVSNIDELIEVIVEFINSEQADDLIDSIFTNFGTDEDDIIKLINYFKEENINICKRVLFGKIDLYEKYTTMTIARVMYLFHPILKSLTKEELDFISQIMLLHYSDDVSSEFDRILFYNIAIKEGKLKESFWEDEGMSEWGKKRKTRLYKISSLINECYRSQKYVPDEQWKYLSKKHTPEDIINFVYHLNSLKLRSQRISATFNFIQKYA